jgi:hypothetical protein
VRISSVVYTLLLPLFLTLPLASLKPEPARDITFQDDTSAPVSAPFPGEEPREAAVQSTTVILADRDDPYYALAEQIAHQETLPILESLDEVMAQDPMFLLWVASPSRLSDQVLVDFGLAMRNRESAISAGIISGATLDKARELWLRASQVSGQRVIAATAANPSGNIEAKITILDEEGATVQALTKENLVRGLQEADYLTFAGHGGGSHLELYKNALLRPAGIPRLPPIVIATASCNTFRIFQKDSIALAFVSKGAAAYAGFAYSPNEGYLIGEFEGLPFRYTWPDFTIGQVIQVQIHGTLQGFARFPYYHLLGDPRIALQAEAPYDLVTDHEEGNVRTLTYADAATGFIPVRIPGGARYSFVEIVGATAAWQRDPFYNSRLQMVNIREDKYLLFDHDGGDFTLRLCLRPKWYWMATDFLTDSLDEILVYGAQTGGDIISFFAGGIAMVGVLWMLRRSKEAARALVPSAVTGIGFAALQGLYALARLDEVAITSKVVEFSPLSVAATFLLTFCGAFLFLNARSRLVKVCALLVATFPTWAAIAFSMGIIATVNVFVFQRELGTDLYNYALGLLPLGAFVFECVAFGVTFFVLRRWRARAG